MGLFDKRDNKKKSDDFNSPVESIDLNAPPVELSAKPSAPGGDTDVASSSPAPDKTVVDSPPDDDDDHDVASYGIQQAIELMRTLPSENVELVVRVVKQTLESTHIKISRIINDAAKKQSDIQARIKVLRDEIAEHESEIASRRKEISGLEADYNETSMVKDRLSLAERLSSGESVGASKLAGGEGSGPNRTRAARDSSTPLPTRPRTSTKPPPGVAPVGDQVVASTRPKSSTSPPGLGGAAKK